MRHAFGARWLQQNPLWKMYLLHDKWINIHHYTQTKDMEEGRRWLQGDFCQMQKSIKLLLLDASFSWPGITFLLKYYVWRFLCQNFMGLSWIVCPQHQIEVKEAFLEWAHFQLKIFFFKQGSFSLICSHLKTTWAIDARLVSNGR